MRMANDDKIGKCPQCGTPVSVLMRKGALTHATRGELIEAFARAICRGAGNNPDDIGASSSTLEGGRHLLWDNFRPQAVAVLGLLGFEERTKTRNKEWVTEIQKSPPMARLPHRCADRARVAPGEKADLRRPLYPQQQTQTRDRIFVRA